MNILLVDDIKDNREALERLIVQYSRIYNTQCHIYKAQDGVEAINICKSNPIDLIFMDIIMPIMDGLEATEIICNTYPEIMIVVVSSENNESVKKEIINSGAEDYILKPLSSAIMLKRLNNYSKLISTPKYISFQAQAFNSFTSNIYSYQMKFFISTDDELSQFWETSLLRFNFQNHMEQLNDFVRLIFGIGTLQIQKSYKCHLYIEEDENFFYFSMDNMKLLPITTVKEMIEKICQGIIHEFKKDYISFALPKIIQEYHLNTDEVPMLTLRKELKTTQGLTHKDSLQTYEIMALDTLNEFEYTLTKLKTEIMMMGSCDLVIQDIDTINIYVKKLVNILSISHDTYLLAQSLKELTILLDEYSQSFLDMSRDLSQMMQSFINDIIMWKEMVFYTGAPSVDFLNSSISSNVQMIKALFVVNETLDDNLDDIFDF
ncbi:MAG: response regulator [Sulfurimonas sp.]|nr:response regulator [Sulfurimonas sp.]